MRAPAPSAARHLEHRYGELTRQQRQVADYVLAHPFEAATLAIDALAARCAVSVATMNRLARALGYPSYSAFRADWQQLLRGGVPPIEPLLRQRERSATARERVQATLSGGGEHLRAADALLDEATLARVGTRLVGARRIAVLGGDVSAYLAGYFASYASLFRDGVDAISGLGGASEAERRVLALGPEDVLLAVSLPRYSALTVELAALARAREVHVIALTDGPAAPIVEHAHESLLAPSQPGMLPASAVGAIALLEGLCAVLAAHSPRSRDELLARSQRAARFHVVDDAARR
ncbi:MAG: MurR/RpiR family transcriptional regulator [Burkholderiales bacterium]|nr:MurR/RpiR family transcriptional regulator [Burkholderiales bacterium]